MRAMRTASFASLAPEVFGSNVTLSGIKSRMFSFFFVLVRRTANVIICAPAFSTAALISSMEYFPDPKIKREENSFPPNVNVSLFIVLPLFCVMFFTVIFHYGSDTSEMYQREHRPMKNLLRKWANATLWSDILKIYRERYIRDVPHAAATPHKLDNFYDIAIL